MSINQAIRNGMLIPMPYTKGKAQNANSMPASRIDIPARRHVTLNKKILIDEK
jgi:hypothetical protein